MALDPVYTRDASSGRVHIRLREGGRLLTDERCNLDEAGGYEVIESVVDVDPESLCGFCFPLPENAAVEEPVDSGEEPVT